MAAVTLYQGYLGKYDMGLWHGEIYRSLLDKHKVTI